jgi:soluble lytic murein transglycosylase-like protein
VRTLLLVACLSAPLFGGEYAVLQTGFRIHADRHETDGGIVRLYTSSGVMEFAATEVSTFEQEYIPPKAAEPPTVAAEPATVPPATPEELIENAARKHGLRPEFVRSIAAVESGFRVDAVSKKGALGLMQLMPKTAAELGVDPKNPADNAEAGTRYLRGLLERYKDRPDGIRLAIAAYNAGPGAVDKHGAIPPYAETQAYVEKVVRKYLQQLASARPGT